ncbi:CheR family methyltransferase [Brevundimonas sp.]|uniref:CheR family methyltransferase n=1 Tax=Brevundimonas sp. TaxID=1871086 RepID=UPI002731F53F|nr:CheR family methyltransferase [Brevundimonas sp.]MDP1913749.1 CheR family methyltransferase [Brevundimonas sp.]
MSRSDTVIVGIGASAGGLEAFKAFFRAMPADSGMAFVLVQHLDPAHPSALVDIVRDCTAMEVSSAEDGAVIRPNRVFVMPPDATLRVEAGVLRLTRPAATVARRVAINTFLTSLAEDQGDNAVGIILSGFGSDGSLGVEAIKEYGGLTLSQAEYDHAPKLGMPQSAVSTGSVDHVLPVADMPACLLDHLRFRDKVEGVTGPDGVRQDVADHLGAISAILNSRLGRDFSQYKTNTIMRRVQRRMQVLRLDTVQAYIEALRERSDEPELLFREVLIRVTRFFRDPAAFEVLAEKYIAPLLARGGAEDIIRVWVPGCATGEEAYSLAILFKEAQALADRPRRIQIFATDIDDQAIVIARAGLYPDTIAADVSPQRLERYFQRDGEHYRVSKDLREMCLFSIHDMVKDPPFSKLDLISCRNLMIYFAAPLQKRVVQMFHYGLKPDGVVLMGASEALTAHGRLFESIDKKHRLSRRLGGVAPSIPMPPVRLARTIDPAQVAPPGAADPEIKPGLSRVLEQFTPAYVVIDQHQDVRQFFGSIAKYLEPATGPASFNLSKLVHADLRLPLRTALKKARSSQTRVVEPGIEFHVADRTETVNLVVEALPGQEGDAGLVLVAFQAVANRPTQARTGGPEAPDNEWNITREQLQTVTEELETANEELQSSNEEYQSVNEELQSANEELETSKEELQSINEELQTVNAELATRNENLTDLNSDMANLIDSTSIATLFLDGDLRIKRFTPTILDLFNVRKGDEGRPITDIVSHLARNGLEQDVRQVIRTLVPVEREVEVIASDHSYQMTVRPYRDVNNVINGVVVTFVDISERKRAEINRAVLAAIIDSSDDAIISGDLDGRITSWNPGAERLFGYSAKDALGQPLTILIPPDRRSEEVTILERVRRGERVDNFETVRQRKDGSLVEISLTVSPIKSADGTIVGASKVAHDISENRRASAALGASEERYRTLFEAIDQGFCIIEKVETEASEPSDYRYLVTNPAFSGHSGVSSVVGRTIREVVPGESEAWFDLYDSVVETGDPIRTDRRLETQGRDLTIYAFRIDDGTQRRLGVLFADVTKSKQAERQSALLLGELDHRVKNILAVVSSVVAQTAKTAGTPQELAFSIEGRIQAIAKAHSLLTQGGRMGVTLAEIVQTELAPYQGTAGRVTVSGEDVTLTPRAGMALSMAIHELTTNAAKYGALSLEDGRMDIRWGAVDDGQAPALRIEWAESGGPPVEPPTRRGFGTTLIERALSYEFDARVQREFLTSGLICVIEIPLTEEVGRLGVRDVEENAS